MRNRFDGLYLIVRAAGRASVEAPYAVISSSVLRHRRGSWPRRLSPWTVA